jgi:hypothetical protein
VQVTEDYFAEEDAKAADNWKLPRVMMWLQKKHSECSAPRAPALSRSHAHMCRYYMARDADVLHQSQQVTAPAIFS